MKRLFDKIYFSAELLSSEVIVSDQKNLIRFLISDTISSTEVSSAEFRIRVVDRTDVTKATIISWTPFEETEPDIYEINSTPTFVKPTDTTLRTIAEIKITDNDSNVFYLQVNSFNLKVL